nr:hypothetical protein [Bacteroidota bacterium]
MILGFAGCDATKRVPEGKYLLDRNHILVSEASISSGELEPILKQRSNKRVLWVRLYLWFYNIPDPAAVAEKRTRQNAKKDIRNEKRKLKGKEPKPYKRTKGEWLREVVG